MSEHTKGRLAANYLGGIFGGAANGLVAQVTKTANPNVCAANARRLVACWNACEGMHTADLESEPGFVTNTIKGLTVERKELIEALGLMFKAWEQLMPNLKHGVVQNYELVCTTAPAKARALLAKHAPKGTR